MADSPIRDILAQVSPARLREDLHYLCVDPLPVRRANYARPGQSVSTLDEADAFIAARLESLGYAVERQPCRVQAFRCRQHAPKSTWYAAPHPNDPWYDVNNLIVERPGSSHADEIVVACAHKDSQSWVGSPGAYDNAVGTVALLELARLLRQVEPHRTLRLLWCCEEHTPWTSAAYAKRCRERGENLIAIFNCDGLAGRDPELEAAGRRTFVAAYTEPAGQRLAELTATVNSSYDLGLEHSVVKREFPNDDDGSFVKAGYPAAIVCIGSFPYRHRWYHDERDTAEGVDVELLAASAQVVLGAVLQVDRFGAV